MRNIFKRIGSVIGAGGRAFVALVGVAGITAAVANYAMTQGSGTTFGSVVVGGIHYAQQFICDLTTPSQCAAVDSSGKVSTKDTDVLAAVNSPIPAQSVDTWIGNVKVQQGLSLLSATNPLPVAPNPYPVGAVPYTNSATGTTTGAVATLAGAASVTTYICGFSVRANATAATTVNLVVSGTISGSLNFTQWVAPLASGLGIAEMIFNPCVPASGTNTSIVVTGGAPGAGGVNSATAWGYKL